MKSIHFVFWVCIFWNTPMTAQLTGIEFTYTDLQTLCKTLGSEKTIVGLGESTHGTKEFTSIRAEIIKALVTQYHYRAFILEADYAPCEKINQYLSTGNGDIASLLVDLRLWPWIHEDFLRLLIWLKDYNLQNPLQKVQFYGMDSQYSKIFATKDAILLQYPDWGRQLFEIAEGKEGPKVKITKLRNFDAQTMKESDTIDLRRHYYVLCQINKLAQSIPQNKNIRDENMARLIQLIQKQNGDSIKAMIWAHNSHISKQGTRANESTALGHHLAAMYGKAYAAVGLEFLEGEFLAVDYENAKERTLRTFSLNPTQTTLATAIDFGGKDIRVVSCHDLRKKYYLNSIGAVYVAHPGKINSFYSKIEKNKEYDYLVVSPKSSAINLLPQYFNK